MSLGRYILDEDGIPVEEPDPLKWGQFLQNGERRVAYTPLPRMVTVSTVFLGLDHNYYWTGPAILWETMIFGGPLDGYQDRYSSREAAVLGHERAVWMARFPDLRAMLRAYRQKKGLRKAALL